MSDCVDSDKREYLPSGITEVLGSLDFIARGYNLCILGESDAGKSVSASKEGVVHNRSFFVILTTDSFEALFISYFKPAGIW